MRRLFGWRDVLVVQRLTGRVGADDDVDVKIGVWFEDPFGLHVGADDVISGGPDDPGGAQPVMVLGRDGEQRAYLSLFGDEEGRDTDRS